ncbi:methyltransferase domain-containing protein [Colletotrichum incanum]|nr:methyltransferase domain-containing protein [Colletotrichum incanum]
MAQNNQDNQPVILDVDDESDDTRSEMGSSIASSSTSLRSSILDYRFENGRTYHRYKDGKYNIPNDQREMERLDSQHYLWLFVLDDRLGVAPPCHPDSEVGRVLDVGTGSGIWAVNFGDEHPESDVLAMDLSPTFPDAAPPNVTFEVDDLEEDWTYSRPFDYIHSRVMTACVNDWKVYLQKCYDNLVPGGWVELQELDLFPRSDDGTLTPDHPLIKCCQLLLEASEIFGRPYIPIPPLKELLTEIGFVDVSLSIYKWPTNPWAKDPKYKELGELHGQNMAEGLEGFCMAPLTRAHNWTPEEVNVFLVDVRNNLKDRNIHAYWPIYCLIGRKPEKEPTPAPPAPASLEAASPTPAPSSPPAPVASQPQSPAKTPATDYASIPAADQTSAEASAKSPAPASS